MAESKTISRQIGDGDRYGFTNLRKEGIELAQNLSGSEWTDYNYHDPGVTILEQFCFALTDLIYRANFDVADYLCDEEGKLNTPDLGLHEPQAVFFCRPVSELDYKKALIDSSNDLSDVQFLTEDSFGKSNLGLHSISIRRSQVVSGLTLSDNDLIEQTYKQFHSMRNLCEDVQKISVLHEVECLLELDVTLSSGFQPESLLAEVYLEASEELAMEVSYKSYSADLEHGISLDDVMSGPYTKKGILTDHEITNMGIARDKSLLESTILAIAQKITGIDYITSLRLRASETHASSEVRLRLMEPRDEKDISAIIVRSGGRRIQISFEEFREQFQKFKLIKESQIYDLNEDIYLSKTLNGRNRNLSDYQSIQNQFPATYGINQMGIPENYPEERRAQALQLKSYLLLFEQIMANYLANLDSIRELFSLDTNSDSTYFSTVLDPEEISNLQRIYPENAEELLGSILEKVDNFLDRKTRLLDYMLALYGENYEQEKHRSFNYYHTPEELEKDIILNKVRLLNRIEYLSGHRSAAGNMLSSQFRKAHQIKDSKKSECVNSVSGLQYRVSLFLGFKELEIKPLTKTMFDHKLCLIPHDSFVDRQVGLDFSEYVINNSQIHRAKGLFQEDADDSDDRYYECTRRMYGQIEPMSNSLISTALLQCGVDSSNYLYDKETRKLNLKIKNYDGKHLDTAEYMELLSSVDAKEASKFIRFLRRFFIHLSNKMEGMHVVEHLLLRPGSLSKARLGMDNFFSNRVSVIFPSWTARCSDLDFRNWAEGLVRENCPAHITPEIYWLDFNGMCEFEVLYSKWSDLLEVKKPSYEPNELDEASLALVQFLISRRMALNFSETEALAGEIENDIKIRCNNYLLKLYERKQELTYSKRRNADSEEDYLQEIDEFKREISELKIYFVEHSQLLPDDFKLRDEDWDFYIPSVSFILPKIRTFQLKTQGKAHFHVFKSIVESELLKRANSNISIHLHWLIPSDLESFKSIYSHWKSLSDNSIMSNSALDTAAKNLRNRLRLLNESRHITSNILSWEPVQVDMRNL